MGKLAESPGGAVIQLQSAGGILSASFACMFRFVSWVFPVLAVRMAAAQNSVGGCSALVTVGNVSVVVPGVNRIAADAENKGIGRRIGRRLDSNQDGPRQAWLLASASVSRQRIHVPEIRNYASRADRNPH